MNTNEEGENYDFKALNFETPPCKTIGKAISIKPIEKRESQKILLTTLLKKSPKLQFNIYLALSLCAKYLRNPSHDSIF